MDNNEYDNSEYRNRWNKYIERNNLQRLRTRKRSSSLLKKHLRERKSSLYTLCKSYEIDSPRVLWTDVVSEVTCKRCIKAMGLKYWKSARRINRAQRIRNGKSNTLASASI